MPNKRKCKYKPCGKFGHDYIITPRGAYCTHEHIFADVKAIQARATEKALKRAEREQKTKHAKQKRDFYENDIKTRKAAAKAACHAYIRQRDHGKPCICCNREFKDSFHAGHYLESGNNPRIRYDEDNIHGQSSHCNVYQGGNSDDYRGNLIKKIGLERVERLESMKGGTMKRTAQDYKEIEVYFKQKLKELIGECNA